MSPAIAPVVPGISLGVIGVARNAKNVTVPITRTVSAEPMNERRTVAIERRPKGTPHAMLRANGAIAPNNAAATRVGTIGYWAPVERYA